jgi:hypothetical protein
MIRQIANSDLEWVYKVAIPSLFKAVTLYLGETRGSVVIKALCYKPEGRGFETWWSKSIFSIYLIPPAALGPWVYSARPEAEKYF